MDNYKGLYLHAFNRITDAINALSANRADEARDILIRAQQECEELYISAGADGEENR